jgi:REP element-mobilizing transposase RayT
MIIEPLQTISWAYQLHYYLCFRTRRCRSVFITPEHVDALNVALREICQRHNYHLLQSKIYPDHLRCLLSLRPEQAISSVIQTIKANSARLFNAQFESNEPLWGRGFLAQHFIGQQFPDALIQANFKQLWQASAYAGTTGNVTTALVKAFLSEPG